MFQAKNSEKALQRPPAIKPSAPISGYDPSAPTLAPVPPETAMEQLQGIARGVLGPAYEPAASAAKGIYAAFDAINPAHDVEGVVDGSRSLMEGLHEGNTSKAIQGGADLLGNVLTLVVPGKYSEYQTATRGAIHVAKHLPDAYHASKTAVQSYSQFVSAGVPNGQALAGAAVVGIAKLGQENARAIMKVLPASVRSAISNAVTPVVTRLQSVAPNNSATDLLAEGLKTLMGDRVVDGLQTGISDTIGTNKKGL